MQLVTEDNITELAKERWGTAHDERSRELLAALVQHLHDFAREVRLTEDEWMAAIQWLKRTGQISDDKREEFILVVTGTVRSLDGTPIGGAVLDVWQADEEGAYEAQLQVEEARLRAKYTTREDGTYCIHTIAPKGYSIPMDGPVGDLIRQTDISHFRPAHVHFLLNVPGYRPLITHLFEEGAEFLDTDVVFGTKQELVVGYQHHEPGPTPDGGSSEVPWASATYDFVLQPV
jgi:hydroxyquinol 1,2-dioxygenase